MGLATLEPTAGMKCIQHILLAFNAIFIFTGVILISVGGPANDINIDYAKLVDNQFLTPPVMVIVIGCLVFAVALFGCYGAYKLSVAAIMVFCFLLTTVFVLELIVGLVAYVMQDQIESMLVRTFNQTMLEYQTDPAAANSIDSVQYQLYCCGIQGPQDWYSVVNPEKYNQDAFVKVYNSDLIVPSACCRTTQGYGNNECIFLKPMGCLPRLKYLISQCSLLLSSTVFMIALMQFLGVIFAYKLARELRKQKSLRDRLKWEVKENIIAGDFALPPKSDIQSEYSRLPAYS